MDPNQKKPERENDLPATPDEETEGDYNDQDPGERQKRNQNDEKEDPLAS